MMAGTPHEEAIFLALGLVTYVLRAGFLMYPQRLGLCSLSFWQEVSEGVAPGLIGSRHGFTFTGPHVIAYVVLFNW
ncbi:hypothetical protein DVH24_035281 [Malus domestica]|uniref:Uncharacterized protein n=1 Tax=Malus domestica TaxID=3750 RepID=A0A498J768_MALDO|nr:hypothetical protein DVH24_035281 [Malus domestica]